MSLASSSLDSKTTPPGPIKVELSGQGKPRDTRAMRSTVIRLFPTPGLPIISVYLPSGILPGHDHWIFSGLISSNVRDTTQTCPLSLVATFPQVVFPLPPCSGGS